MTRFGGFFPPFPQGGLQPLVKAEKALDRPIEIIMWFQHWGSEESNSFQADWVKLAGSRQVLITWEPWVPSGKAEQPDYSLSRIVAGDHDKYLTSWATAAKSLKQTIYLRPMHEMNGNWYPWGGVVNGNRPADFIAAWRHIWELFAGQGVTNVKWVWCPNADDVPTDNRLEDYYPGEKYVDVLALSGYNWGDTQSWSRWRSFREVFSNYYDRIAALGSQPIWIAEVGCAPTDGDKVEWCRQMLAELPRFERLEALVWFNIDKEADWRITYPAKVAKVFAK